MDVELFNKLERENVEMTQRIRAQDAELAELRERRTHEYTPTEADAERAAQRNRELLATVLTLREQLTSTSAALHRLLAVTKQREAQAREMLRYVGDPETPASIVHQARALLAANPPDAPDAPKEQP